MSTSSDAREYAYNIRQLFGDRPLPASTWKKKHFYPCGCVVAFRAENGVPRECPAHREIKP